jgi:hypothetical protein
MIGLFWLTAQNNGAKLQIASPESMIYLEFSQFILWFIQ